MSYKVYIRGKLQPDDGWQKDLGALPAGKPWWLVPLPQCPDCGGDLVWYEAGYVPGTRKCMGLPIGGRPTNPMLDPRVPKPDEVRFPTGVGLYQVHLLYKERTTCPDGRVEEIDQKIIAMLYPWVELDYNPDEGCGSMFNIGGWSYEPGGHLIVFRERFL